MTDRRSFIKQVSPTGLLSSMPEILLSQQKPSNDKIWACLLHVADQRLLGFIQSPWKFTIEENSANILKSIELAGNAKNWFDKNHH